MVTIKELARELNVSISTVSKALNDNPEISDITIARIKELAVLRNYKPNKAAVSLKRNKTMTIGVIIPDILNHFFAKVLHGIEEASSKLGYNIITCISNESYEKEVDILQLLADGTVDGFILAVAEETQVKNISNHFKKVLDDKIPIVMFDRIIEDINCDKVIIDDFEATYDATKTLLNEGRKNIVLINQIGQLSVGKHRVEGYKKAIEDYSSYSKSPNVVVIDKNADLEQSIISIFEENTDLDGIISIDNISGVTAINVAKNRDLAISKDISIIGFSSDDILAFSSPKLSTVAQHGETIGSTAVKLLIDRLENKTTLKKVIKTVPFLIKLRETTK
ncbi:LacI family DNA-binding transcriptional regulator [Winogradskyella immobilis]|uniref:LacI family DNA-binding transcriptional regulator n=1 Tax=Winogradskyella immobilis TaxID=2816852 RepID=A0ABS8ERC2_9FLAO|nr:LacI family DNA-binding transcriptional regulator [Winogradskyella immobilis]MCC1485441.1 LacI family DNA-binding transcriptional regulator [Winogradskyella immobilis]MCG0017533.1 LacI family transcriptional regulator [Winogradskyella immobilis]